jgi:hypothetical protein
VELAGDDAVLVKAGGGGRSRPRKPPKATVRGTGVDRVVRRARYPKTAGALADVVESTVERLNRRYPRVDPSVSWDELRPGAYGQYDASEDAITFDVNALEAPQGFANALWGDRLQGWHSPYGATPQGLGAHEFGHAYVTEHPGNILEFANTLPRRFLQPKRGLNPAVVEQQISQYANTNPREFAAEALTDYWLDPTPSPLARRFGRYATS